jgi:hypothetical protein
MNHKYLELENSLLFAWFATLMTKSIEQPNGKPVKQGKLDYYKQELFKQFLIHFLSIKKLESGINVTLDTKENRIDATESVLVLIRACLENYCMFHYIYRETNRNEVIYFRFWSWMREGLLARQKFVLDAASHVQKQEQEKREIEHIYNDLKASPVLKEFNPKQQIEYKKSGKWYFVSKATMLEKSGFTKKFSKSCYSYFSLFTHPTSAGHLQTSQWSYEVSRKTQDMMLKALFMASGLYLKNYSEMFQEVGQSFSSEDKEFIVSWCDLAHILME